MKLIILISLFFTSCQYSENTNLQGEVVEIENTNIVNAKGFTIESRFAPPKDYQRAKESHESFARYLRNLSLFPEGKKVALYNGNFNLNYALGFKIGTKLFADLI